MNLGGRRNEGVDGRQPSTSLLRLPEHDSPLPSDIKVDLQNPALEAAHEIVFEPSLEFGTPFRRRKSRDPFLEFADGDDTQEKMKLPLTRNPFDQ